MTEKKRKPQINGDLADAAAALLLCQHDSPLIKDNGKGLDNAAYEGEEHLMLAREAASKYLVACFTWAATAYEDDEDDGD